jgi:hypothetical protein
VVKAFDQAELTCAQRQIQQEREWLRHFERDSRGWFSSEVTVTFVANP